MEIQDYSAITFKGSSTVTINNNHATDDGGAFHITLSSVVFEEENCRVTINNNQATGNGGALCINDNSSFTVKGNSIVTITNNQATYGVA